MKYEDDSSYDFKEAVSILSSNPSGKHDNGLLSKFAWTLCSSVWIVFNNFLLIDAKDRCTIISYHQR